MKNTLRRMFLVIEVNLLLWIAVVGTLWASDAEHAKTVALVGLGIATVFQHWAYYALRKSAATFAHR